MNWTAEQARAIELKNKNILVAAAAGSGKTAVLVERIKRLILEDRCPIDKMLIVTFTNAAASEMKEKIQKAINQAIREAGETGNREDLIFLKKQLDLLPNANISTFHAFALEVIRRYFYIIDIEPDFKICDGSQQTILRGQAMDQLLEERFEEGSREFYDFLNKFSGDRNNDKVREMVEKAFDVIQSLPEPYQWLDRAAAGLGADFETFMASPAIKYVFGELREGINAALENLEENLRWAETHHMGGYLELARTDLEMTRGLAELVRADSPDFDKIRQALEGFRLPSMIKKYTDPAKNPDADQLALAAAKEYIGAGRELIKEVVSAAKKSYFYDTAENIYREVLATAGDGLYLAGLIKDFDRLYGEKKAEKGLVDFSDIEHFAYNILKDEEASAFYRDKFQHIFIDEYQDSNVLQEALIGTIRRENNLFMVGDVKQSIYKFRLAEPEIFQAKYKDYAQQMAAGEDSLSEKIDLNKNFRSKAPVISFINRVFEKTMPDYDENAALYVGDPYGDRSDHEPKLFLVQTGWNEEDEPDEELKLLIKAEKEALAAARIIRGALGKPFFDSKQGRERPLEKKDIVILMRGVKNYGDIFYRILTENNLPAYVDDNDGFFDTIEINTFMALLALIDNRKQDIPLLTVMRSEILGYTIEELAAVRIACREGSYYHAVETCAEGGGAENLPEGLEGLGEKCRNTLKKIEEWQQMSRILPLEELVWQLMLYTGFYIAMGAMPAGSQRQANLRALVDKALSYRSSQDGSLYGFMKYIDAVKEKKVPMGQVKMLGEEDDTIRIMTIHKSKGLEFPMVLLAGFCRKLNYTSLGKGAAIHKDFGIGLPYVNYGQSWYRTTILQNIIKNKFRKEEAEEEKRILYVALTRARDMLAILGILDDVPEEIQNVMEKTPEDSSYFKMTGRTICSMPGVRQEITGAELTGLSKGRKRAAGRALAALAAGPGPVSPDILSRLTFAYPHEAELAIKSKYSVSELAARSHDGAARGTVALAEPASFKVSAGFTPAQTGTITHKVLEKMDFVRAAAEGNLYVASLLESLVSGEFLTAEEAAAVDIDRITDFARSELGRRIAASPAVYREKPFNLIYNIDGTDTMVQGIIDCFFEEDGQLVLVDYKTSGVRTPEELARRKAEITARYALQMEIYRKALETITGKKVKEANLYLTNAGETIRM